MSEITRQQIQDFISHALREDIGSGDHTSLACIPPDSRSKAQLLVKESCVLAGVELAHAILHHEDNHIDIQSQLSDGDQGAPGDVVFIAEGNTQALLRAERLLLNSMQRMSGIATISSRYAAEVADLPVRILDTRKTTPLIRFLEKWAVRIGGCHNYRDGLYDWIMIKDNHVEASGGIAAAIERVRQYLQAEAKTLGITLEVRNFKELDEALRLGGITRIMLDNFNPQELRQAVERINGRFETEASGGITLATLREFALSGVQYISVGALTHHATSVDLSFKIIA